MANPVNPSHERRSALRFHGESHGIAFVRIRPGHRGSVVDISTLGALLETNHQMLPGAIVQLHMERDTHHVTIGGRVLRCLVSSVKAAHIKYQGAVLFDRHLAWFPTGIESGAVERECGADLPAREDATRLSI